MNFVILDHPRSQLCGLITLSKFGIDPIFPAGDITICQFGWKIGFLGVLNPLILNPCGRYPNAQNAHPWMTTRHLSHKWLKPVQRYCDSGFSFRSSVGITEKASISMFKKWHSCVYCGTESLFPCSTYI